MTAERNDKSLVALLADLTRDTVELVRQEIALARAELSEKVSTAQGALSSMAIGAAVLLAGLFLLLQAAVQGLALVLPPDLAQWLSPLLIGIAVIVIGWVMLRAGRSKLDPGNLAPHRTMESLRRDKAVVQERAR